MRVETLLAAVLLLVAIAPGVARAGGAAARASVFRKGNLVAWCIVPFDAKQRGPKERAEMLARLGIGKLAYDWRGKHVPTFEDEIVQMKAHGIEFFAFWGFHPTIGPLVRKHGVKPQFWITVPSPRADTQEQRVEAAGKALLGRVKQARELGCKLGLYNHGGWGGEPSNMVAVCQWLRANAAAGHVGIVYNFHHGHGHIADFPQVLEQMKPYLLCLNLNGMKPGGPKILPIGQGAAELDMMKAIAKSGYAGPIGILDHRSSLDAEESLKQNLEGMKQVLEQMGDEAALETY
jgi:sugar phosphate isomerase/epimerase